ncbi:cytochrome P450 enzyme phantom isoform X2 [Rhynchophorus ferrugineus]
MICYILIALVLICLKTLWQRRKLPPGPWGLPLVGYLPFLDPKAPQVSLTELAKKYGPMYSLLLGNVRTIVLSDPKLIKTLFAKDVTTGRAPLYLTHGIMNGYGIICAQGDLWKDQRRFVHNCLRHFGASKIGPRDNMEKLIIKHVKEFVRYIKTLDTKQPIDPLRPLRHCLGSIINEIVFGRSWERGNETWEELQELQEEGLKYIGIAGPLNFLPFLRFLPMFKRPMSFLIKGQHKTHRFYQKLINEENVLLNKSRSADLDTNSYTNFIQGFLIEREKRQNTDDVHKYYNEKQFHHLLADVFGAGLDTTLVTLRWFLLYIARNTKIQSQLRDDLKTILNDRDPSLNDMESLPFVEACLSETQRIRSVVPIGIPHGALDDIKLNGYVIPKGAMIVPLQWAVHMNEKVYPEPENFNPSRFINEEGRYFKPEYFIPFQNGKRMCIGDELARMMMFLVSTTILKTFHLDLEDHKTCMEGESGITLSPQPYKLIFSEI